MPANTCTQAPLAVVDFVGVFEGGQARAQVERDGSGPDRAEYPEADYHAGCRCRHDPENENQLKGRVGSNGQLVVLFLHLVSVNHEQRQRIPLLSLQIN
eukprot:1675043-Rhodomonas_salina.1